MNRIVFADRLKALRAELALSQPELAERTGIKVGTIRHLEQGRREPSYSTLIQLVEGLGVSLAVFDRTPANGQAAAKARKRGPRVGGAA
jgi:transcriptional regulator with XRE-family HTH domain